MRNILKNEDGKALGIILSIVGAIIIVAVIALVLTVTGSYKYPPSAVNWPGVGSFIAQYGKILEIVDDTEGEEETLPGDKSADYIMDLQDDGKATLIRDLTFKKQRIDELEGEMETRNDQISKLNEELQLFKTQLEHYKPENRKALIKIYDRMEAAAAVEILSQIPEQRAVIILSSLKDSKAAEILAAMENESAVKITELMAGFEPTRITDMGDLPGKKRPIPRTTPGQPPQLNPPPKKDFNISNPNPQDTLKTSPSGNPKTADLPEDTGEIVGPPPVKDEKPLPPEDLSDEEESEEEEEKPESPPPTGDESTG